MAISILNKEEEVLYLILVIFDLAIELIKTLLQITHRLHAAKLQHTGTSFHKNVYNS